ncbi:MAG: histidine kinase [Clostridia bacterium]|nr:histidine kinase [Clostridia bacterium]
MGSNSIKGHEALSHDAIVRALFENYESIYAVDAETSLYKCFYESDSYSSLHLKGQGSNFFDALDEEAIKAVYFEDREFVKNMLSKQALSSGLGKEKFYSFVYRLIIDGQPLYHKLRATMGFVEGRQHFLIGIRNVDAAFRQDKALAEKLSSMHSKDLNHLEAILASAEGYLEANLTKDLILEYSSYKLPAVLPASFRNSAKKGTLTYSAFEKWHVEHLVEENKAKYKKISDKDYLINCYEHGEKRASASFSMRLADGQLQPCKIVFYLYQDTSSGDILSFCVLYDLTEQQRKEKELRDLENELQMSRLRNFTSQMQPHFLYNALGSIQEIVLEDPAYASELIGDFTIHLRSCIRAMANDAPIPFDQELANIKSYVNIEKMRFGKKLTVIYDIKKRDFLILPLSVQPIVENAIRHGIYERGEEGGVVTIKTVESEGNICVTVEDTGVGFDVEAYQEELSSGEKDSTGLKNIMFRLDKMMRASVDIKSRIGVGTKVTITIPREKRKDESDYS